VSTLGRTGSVAGAALFLSGALLAQGQSATPQFRTGVELLQLDVTVLDTATRAAASCASRSSKSASPL